MYTLTTANYRKILVEATEYIKVNDRDQYLPFYRKIEEFCNKRLIIIGGIMGVNLLLGKAPGLEDYYWELYTDNVYRTAIELVTELYNVRSKYVDVDTLICQTELRNKIISISVQNRIIVRLYSLGNYLNINVIEIINYISKPGFFLMIDDEVSDKGAKIKSKSNGVLYDLKCFGPIPRLIDIYRNLYDPNKFDQINHWLDIEKELFTYYISLYKIDKDGVVCGDPIEVGKNITLNGSANVVGGGKDDKYLSDYYNRIRKILTPDDLIIGDYALFLLGLNPNPSRIQLLSRRPITEWVRKLNQDINNPNIKFHSGVYRIPIPNDFRLVKFTIYVVQGTNQRSICDIYNSPDYEIIPYWIIPNNQYIANPFVVLRFIIINVWILTLIIISSNLRDDQKKSTMDRVKIGLTQIYKLRQFIIDKVRDGPTLFFQDGNYIGIYTNEFVALKEKIKKSQQFPMVYYPAKRKLAENVKKEG